MYKTIEPDFIDKTTVTYARLVKFLPLGTIGLVNWKLSIKHDVTAEKITKDKPVEKRKFKLVDIYRTCPSLAYLLMGLKVVSNDTSKDFQVNKKVQLLWNHIHLPSYPVTSCGGKTIYVKHVIDISYDDANLDQLLCCVHGHAVYTISARSIGLVSILNQLVQENAPTIGYPDGFIYTENDHDAGFYFHAESFTDVYPGFLKRAKLALSVGYSGRDVASYASGYNAFEGTPYTQASITILPEKM